MSNEDVWDYPRSGAKLAASLLALSPEQFVGHHILERVPAFFRDHRSYIEWKTPLAAELGVDPISTVVVGSASLGYSLSPQKFGRKFNKTSDIDVAVVSHRHFEEAWRWVRELGPGEFLATCLTGIAEILFSMGLSPHINFSISYHLDRSGQQHSDTPQLDTQQEAGLLLGRYIETTSH
jgi:hypothetical protein